MGRTRWRTISGKKPERPCAGDGRAPVVDTHDYASPDAMFDARIYPKGGWILHMLRRRLGEDAFWRGIRRAGASSIATRASRPRNSAVSWRT